MRCQPARTDGTHGHLAHRNQNPSPQVFRLAWNRQAGRQAPSELLGCCRGFVASVPSLVFTSWTIAPGAERLLHWCQLPDGCFAAQTCCTDVVTLSEEPRILETQPDNRPFLVTWQTYLYIYICIALFKSASDLNIESNPGLIVPSSFVAAAVAAFFCFFTGMFILE